MYITRYGPPAGPSITSRQWWVWVRFCVREDFFYAFINAESTVSTFNNRIEVKVYIHECIFWGCSVDHWESPEIKKRQKIDQKFPFWSCQNRFVTSQELPICTTCTCVVQNGKSWLFITEIQITPLTSRSFPQKMECANQFWFLRPRTMESKTKLNSINCLLIS
jgi:hypothetical protein